MKRNIFLLMLCLFGLIGAMAQTKTATGVVTDQAQDPFNKAIPSYTKEQIQKIVLLAQQEFFSNGLTMQGSLCKDL